MKIPKMNHTLLVASAVVLASCSAGNPGSSADINQDGGVSFDEFDAYMKDAVFAHFDSGKTGKVTKEDYQKVNPDKPISEFNKVDRNGDGVITKSESDAAFDKEGSMKKLFKKIDTDGSGTLSPSEIKVFKAAMKAQPGRDDLGKLENAATTS